MIVTHKNIILTFIVSVCAYFISKAAIPYQSFENDPYNVRIYTLDNGLKIYTSVLKNAPRIQTYIAVKAGSKFDPVSLTGLAHYLEHMVFKGTSQIGAIDFKKEQKYLDEIEALYEIYRAESDTAKRRKIYAKIDSVSNIAARLAIANEYDKIVSGLGAQGTNAYTWVEQTVYINDIPSNELERWAKTEAERFGELTPRLFHTELEAVYEEKNRSIDNDFSKVIEETFAAMFPNHPYGTQTTIGTVEHLKNPSIKAIKEYFYTYYVPNNMAICLSGDFNPDSAVAIINKYWGNKKSKPIPVFTPATEAPIEKPIVKTVTGPSPASVTLCYRFPGAASKDIKMMEMFSKILSNGTAGVLDLNLVQKQKVLNASVFPYSMKDYSINLMFANPREGQTLEEVKNLLLEQIEQVKKGNFDEELMKAIILNEKIEIMKALESNRSRADALVDAFVKDIPWNEYIAYMDELSKITKKQVVDFANKYYGDNYSVVYKTVGKDTTRAKVPKPKITPITVNRDAQSEFYKTITASSPAPIEPVFLDYAKEISVLTVNGIPLYTTPNTANQLFELHFVFDMGSETNPKLALAAQYLGYLGTQKQSAEALKTAFYKIGCNYQISVGGDKIQISLTGLQENFDKGLKLLQEWWNNPKADIKAYNDLIEGILKQRANAKLDKATILRAAMVNYAKYGEKNPFTNIIPEKELKNIKPQQLIILIKNLKSFEHRILYYGTSSPTDIANSIKQLHNIPKKLNPVPAKNFFKELDFNDNVVYWVDFDMVQAEMLFLHQSVKFDKNLIPQAQLYNEYFGGGMGSVVFQEIRESKALAYASMSRYTVARDTALCNYGISYIGTQADKLTDAMQAMKRLLDSIPTSQALFSTSKESLMNVLRTQRITGVSKLFDYENAKKMGYDSDIRQQVYQSLPSISLNQIVDFHKKYATKGAAKVLVIGSKDRLDIKALEKYGKVQQLSLEAIFGH